MWLCVLALIDLSEVRRLRRTLLIASREMLYREMGQWNAKEKTGNGEAP